MGRKKATSDFMGKCLKFTGPQGEDQGKIEEHWPFDEPKLNVMSERDRKRLTNYKQAS